MVLLDSNIVIYLRDPYWGEKIAKQFSSQRLGTCNIVIAEVLGFEGLDADDAHYFEQLFFSMKVYPFDEAVTNKVIQIRRTTRIQLPDVIIAATAQANDLVLWTHNIEDFKSIPDLRLLDPISAAD